MGGTLWPFGRLCARGKFFHHSRFCPLGRLYGVSGTEGAQSLFVGVPGPAGRFDPIPICKNVPGRPWAENDGGHHPVDHLALLYGPSLFWNPKKQGAAVLYLPVAVFWFWDLQSYLI